MKIIFDSEEEKENFLDYVCPKDVLPHCTYLCDDTCLDCWENAGVEMDVKKC